MQNRDDLRNIEDVVDGAPDAPLPNEAEYGATLLDLMTKPANRANINRARLLKPLFTSCPKCGAEPWVNIDCAVCEVMSALPR
jgi:hypothetical protein